jgi:hypothetical protein
MAVKARVTVSQCLHMWSKSSQAFPSALTTSPVTVLRQASACNLTIRIHVNQVKFDYPFSTHKQNLLAHVTREDVIRVVVRQYGKRGMIGVVPTR